VSKFSDSRAGVAAALRAGVALEAVAEAEGVSATTVRGWLRRGKREPTSEFGEFLRASEAAVDGGGAMTVDEVEKHLTEVIRAKKSVAAIVAWLRLHGRDEASAGDDPLLAFMPGGTDGRG
jgi:transposase-like protein